MLTAAITAAIAAILSLFGIKLSVTHLVGVAIVVKVIIVMTGVLLSLKWARRRREKAAAESAGAAVPPPPSP
jgi:hypothetical protein